MFHIAHKLHIIKVTLGFREIYLTEQAVINKTNEYSTRKCLNNTASTLR